MLEYGYKKYNVKVKGNAVDNDKIELKVTSEPSIDKATLSIKEKLEYLEKLINAITGSATIAVQGGYGVGKTYLAKCLEKEIEQKDIAEVIYIDLWKNDYKDPLTMFISAIDNKNEKDEKRIELKNKIKNTAKILIPMMASGIMTKLTGINTEDALDKLLNNKDKDAINDLKKGLEALAKDKKIVILIDEIDRCRPEFAVETLETIKHFFEINNIIFILFVNNEYINNLENKYIGNSAYSNVDKGYGIVNKGYIEKFIDLKVSITNKNFAEVINNSGLNILLDIATVICNIFKLEMRDVLQIINNIKLLYKLFPTSKKLVVELLPLDKGSIRANDNPDVIAFLFFLYALKQKNYKGITLTEIIDNRNYLIIQEILTTIENDIKIQQNNIKHISNLSYKNYLDKTDSFTNSIKFLINILAGKSIYSVDIKVGIDDGNFENFGVPRNISITYIAFLSYLMLIA